MTPIGSEMQHCSTVPRVLRRDYRSPACAVREVALRMELDTPVTRVSSRICFERRTRRDEPLILDGEGLRLRELKLDGEPLPADAVHRGERVLTLRGLPASGTLEIVTELQPGHAGDAGLLHMEGAFITHCEPEGFRRITYFPDRPDVLASYRVTLIADRERYPVLLSNGNKVESVTLADGRHAASWEDPHPKSSYSFAVVAGRLSNIARQFVTRSGRPVRVCVYAQPDVLPFCSEGLDTIIRAMNWDEQAYDREYDLDVFNVAVLRNYPGGGMENKGLNLFATEYFVAARDISTDEELQRVRAVVAHEFLHNWTGNRVGIQSWFELGLKEGFTTFRQQQFLASTCDADAARIDDIIRLRDLQYPEDDGPMCHPVRPHSYALPANVFTKTVYEKGAEVIRALQNVVGAPTFSRGVQEFFREQDGRAAGWEDLVRAVERVSDRDLAQFRAWYESAGPTTLTVTREFDASQRRYILRFAQTGADGPAELHIPIRARLLGGQGQSISTGLGEETDDRLLELRAETAEFAFEGVREPPIPSLLRGLSAPVRLTADFSDEELGILACRDTDAYVRWDAMQQLVGRAMGSDASRTAWLRAFGEILGDGTLPLAMKGRMLRLPTEQQLGYGRRTLDIDRLHAQRNACAAEVCRRYGDALRATYGLLARDAEILSNDGARLLRNICLGYLMRAPAEEDLEACRHQAAAVSVFENVWAASRLLIDQGGEDRRRTLAGTHENWRSTPLLLDHWFALQAASESDDCAGLVARLCAHEEFSLDDAARVKALLDTFTANQHAFHDRSGRGYQCVADVIAALNGRNTRLAARFLGKFAVLRQVDPWRRALLTDSLLRLRGIPALAPMLQELIEKCLAPVAA